MIKRKVSLLDLGMNCLFLLDWKSSYILDQRLSFEALKLVAKSALEFINSNYWFLDLVHRASFSHVTL